MLRYLVDFFWNKQTFASAVADLGGLVMIAGTALTTIPELREAVVAAIPPQYLPAAAAGLALATYVAGAVSGRKTAPAEPAAEETR